MTSPAGIFHLALEQMHLGAGATLTQHCGWMVPHRYASLETEHAALREGVAVFDRSSRSRFLLSGTDALDVLSATFTGHIDELEEGRAMRSVRLDANGEIRDVVLIARTGGIAYLVSGEPGQRLETAAALEEQRQDDFDVRIDDRTLTTCSIGVAGPAAGAFVRDHLADALPSRLQMLHSVTFEFHGFRTLATRTSDTGEDGFEFMLAPAVAQHVFETLLAAGARPAGLEALETARIEACIPAFEPDLSEGLSPAEADLDTMLDIPGGRQRSLLSALIFDAAEPPATGTALTSGGEPAGVLRSVARSPALAAVIGLATVKPHLAVPGRELDADGSRATIVAKPFYRRRS